MKPIRFGRAVGDELDNALTGMAQADADDPAHACGRAALNAIKSNGDGFVFNADDPRAVKALISACETIINIDGYGSDEALQFSNIKKSCRRILRELSSQQPRDPRTAS